MTPQLKGQYFRSNPEPWSPGGVKTFKSDYLSGATSWKAPEVDHVCIVLEGSVTATNGGGGALGRDFAKLFPSIQFRLQGQDTYFLSGPSARVIQYVEYGGRVTDPSDVADNTTNASYRGILVIPFGCHRNLRRRDTTVPLADMIGSGEFRLQMAGTNPTGWATAASDWTVTLHTFVIDGRRKEIHPQRRLKEVIMARQEDTYDIGGFLRAAYISSVLTTTGYTSMATITTLDSVSLNFPPAFETFMLQQRYRLEQQVPSTLDENLLATPGALPVVWPDNHQKIGRMPDLRSLHLNLHAAVPASAVLITDTIVERHPDATARTLGYDNAMQAAAQVHANGTVVGAGGKRYKANQIDPNLFRHMPVRVQGM